MRRLLLSLLFLGLLGTECVFAKDFVIFDGMGGYKAGKPDLGQFGLKPIHMVYAGHLWGSKKDARGTWPPTTPSRDDEARIKALASKFEKETPGSLVMLDIEHWHTSASRRDPVEENVRKLALVADWVHQAGPSLKVGYYGVLPIKDYGLLSKGRKGLDNYQADNARITELAKHVDVIFPSIYHLNDNFADWEQWAKITLAAASKFNKPVYPVIWPEYSSPGSPSNGQFIPGDVWARMLTVIRDANADGVVIWSSSPAVGNGGAAWNDSWGWWQATQAFLKKSPR